MLGLATAWPDYTLLFSFISKPKKGTRKGEKCLKGLLKAESSSGKSVLGGAVESVALVGGMASTQHDWLRRNWNQPRPHNHSNLFSFARNMWGWGGELWRWGHNRAP